MKKFLTAAICMFACAMLAFTMLAPSAALAAGTARFEMNDVDGVSPGSEFTVTLSISGDYELHSANLAVSFDPNSLEFVSLEQGSVLTTTVPSKSGLYFLEYENIVAQGLIKLGIAMPLDALGESGDLFKMTFRVRDGVTVNQQIVLTVYELSLLPLGSMTGTPVEFETNNSIVSISGASDPVGGFNQGESGTPNPSLTQIPTIVDSTLDPNVTTRPLTTIPPADGTSSGAESTASGSVSETENPTITYPSTATALPDKDASGDKSGGAGGVKPVVYVLGGAVILCAAAIVIVTIRKNNSNHNKD